ncbi:MAG: prepilin-type N-terminal cleavage/methylation domain-containing protein [Proteobacteria bacterium]|nr:prepilin-type N-terminal cleavage/methylation domain-containing protein [Pseudomonadota bacterium]
MNSNNFNENIIGIEDKSDKKSDNNGYTMIEVLIALAIFSIGILGLAKMQIASTNLNSYSRMATEATTMGGDEMERLMILSYGDYDLNPAFNSEHSYTNNNRTVTWTVTDNPDHKSINMIITYTIAISGTTKTIRLNYIKPQDI